jgi:hypothetical protein
MDEHGSRSYENESCIETLSLMMKMITTDTNSGSMQQAKSMAVSTAPTYRMRSLFSTLPSQCSNYWKMCPHSQQT